MGDKWGAQCEMTRGQEYVGESGGGRINKIGEGGKKNTQIYYVVQNYIYIYIETTVGGAIGWFTQGFPLVSLPDTFFGATEKKEVMLGNLFMPYPFPSSLLRQIWEKNQQR